MVAIPLKSDILSGLVAIVRLTESHLEEGSIFKTDVSFPQNITNISIYLFKEIK